MTRKPLDYWLHALLLCSQIVVATGLSAAVRPYSGLWWQPGENGKFMSVHIGPGDYALVTVNSGQGGSPTYRVLQGQLEFAEHSGDGVVASLRSPLYRIDGTNCLTCAQSQAETVQESAGEYVLTFHTGTVATLLTDLDETIGYEHFPLYTRTEETLALRLPGREVVIHTPNSRGERVRGFAQLRELPPDVRGECGRLIDPADAILQLWPDRSVTFGFCFRHSYLAISAGHNPQIRLVSASYPGCEPPNEKIGIPRTCHVSAVLHQSGNVLAGHSRLSDPGEVTITLLD